MDVFGRFGRRLRWLRQQRGYSQEELAELAGLHRTYVGGIERGERNVSLENIWRLGDALDVSPAAFFPEFPRRRKAGTP
jgi:transcriptional regulator with XRE-family HTH domain